MLTARGCPVLITDTARARQTIEAADEDAGVRSAAGWDLPSLPPLASRGTTRKASVGVGGFGRGVPPSSVHVLAWGRGLGDTMRARDSRAGPADGASQQANRNRVRPRTAHLVLVRAARQATTNCYHERARELMLLLNADACLFIY